MLYWKVNSCIASRHSYSEEIPQAALSTSISSIRDPFYNSSAILTSDYLLLQRQVSKPLLPPLLHHSTNVELQLLQYRWWYSYLIHCNASQMTYPLRQCFFFCCKAMNTSISTLSGTILFTRLRKFLRIIYDSFWGILRCCETWIIAPQLVSITFNSFFPSLCQLSYSKIFFRLIL